MEKPKTLGEMIQRLQEVAKVYGEDSLVFYDGIWYNHETKTVEFVDLIKRESDRWNHRVLTEQLAKTKEKLNTSEGYPLRKWEND